MDDCDAFTSNESSSEMEEGGEDEQNNSNTSKRQKVDCLGDPPEHLNPMMVSLILENVFHYFSKSKADLKNFRLVCKTWDNEVIKIIRSKTAVNLEHIVAQKCDIRCSTTAVSTEAPPPSLRLETHLDVPFGKILLSGTCETLKNPNIIKWFQTMGSSIKQLRFCSSLNCYHQIRFLECVLKIWCKNLSCLYLSGVKSFIYFTIFSRFDKTPFICKLNELIIFSEDEEEILEQEQLVDCEKILDLEKTYLNFTFGKTHDNLYNPVRLNIDAIDLNVATLIDSFASEYVENRPSKETVGDFIKGFKADGGILGQIFGNNNNIERLVVKGLPCGKSDSLIKAFCVRPELFSSLKCLQYENACLFPEIRHWTAFRSLTFPLSKICFGSILVDDYDGTDQISLLLSSFSSTLQHLEFTGTVLLRSYERDQPGEEYINISLPVLPHVTTFINGNIFCTRLDGLDFTKNLPKLQKCSLTNAIYHSSIFPLNPAQVFNLLFQASNFFSYENHESLRELHLDGKISYTRHLELMKEWFPGLKKVELTLDGSDVFVEFFQIMKKAELEDVKLSFYSNDSEWCNLSITMNMKRMACLKFLELIHLSDHSLVITSKTCEDGFAAAPQLISLKLTNFGLYVDEVEAICMILRRLSYVKFTHCIHQYKPADAEFTVCYVSPFPVRDGVEMSSI